MKQGSDTTWSSGVSIAYSVDGLSKGSYSFVVYFFDASNNSVSDTVIVTVSDATNPTVNSPSDVDYNEGETGNTINWIGSDTYPDYYRVFRNGVKEGTDSSWSSGVSVAYDVDGLSKGTYTYVIHFFDVSNNRFKLSN